MEQIVLDVARKLLKEYRITHTWPVNSQAYAAFNLLVETIIEKEQLNDSKEIIHLYGDDLKQIIAPLLESNDELEQDKKEVINRLLQAELSEAGTSFLYHKLREAISMNLFELQAGIPTVEIKAGNQTHVAQLLTHGEEGMVLTNVELVQWETLMTQAITSMDDLTADAFDIISILWMKSAKSEQDMIAFHHEDVLSMRHIQKKKNADGYGSYRKKDRDEVMKRLAALASIWIRVDEDDELHFVDTPPHEKDYKKSKLKRLFQVDNVTIARDRKTDQVIGIYECDIRPGDLLANYLYGAKKSTGFLSLKALQYNPLKHKYHKRLTRYLSWQWRIRFKKDDFTRPYRIGGEKGLLNVMGLELNHERPHRTKDSFENVLDTLQEDGVVASWHYEALDEQKIGKGNPNWLTEYWTQLQVVIEPPAQLLQELDGESKKTLELDEVLTEFEKQISQKQRAPEQLELKLDFDRKEEEVTLSSEVVKEERKKRGLSISKAAKQIGIAHTTLSRYERNLIKKPNSKNDEKIKQWLLNQM